MSKVDRAGQLYDYAVEHPEGFTYQDIERDFEWQRSEFVGVVRTLRAILADDEINLTCEPQGQGEPWLYKLIGSYDDARPWATNRIGDLETRLETIGSVSQTLVSATDGRSIEGRKARKMKSTLDYLRGELADIDGRLM